MSRKMITRSAMLLGLLASSGCCSWCERHCQQKQQPVVCQPAAPVCYAPPAAGYPVPASPPVASYAAPPAQSWANPAPAVLNRQPNGCYCPQ